MTTPRKIKNLEQRKALRDGPKQRRPWRPSVKEPTPWYPSLPQEYYRWVRVLLISFELPENHSIIKNLADNFAVITTQPDDPPAGLLKDDRLKAAHEKLTTPGRVGVKPELLPRMVALMLAFAYHDLTGSDLEPGNRGPLQALAKVVFKQFAFKVDAKDVLEKAYKDAIPILKSQP